jgi:Eukaryotic initiation factor 4E
MLSQHTNTMETAPLASDNNSYHNLSDNWTLWAHLPHNTDWSLKSYIPVSTFTTVEETISVIETLPAALVENCMLFIMRKGINPTWEDPKNRDGGCFSYKVLNKNVVGAWKELTYSVVGGSISSKGSFFDCVTGITISPKKNFCIIKIWMKNCDHQNPAVVNQIKGLLSQGCLFKKHTPEY